MTSPTDRDLPPPFDNRAPGASGHPTPTDGTHREGTIAIVEETAHIGVERRDAGGVRVSVSTVAEDRLLGVDLTSQQVEVTRHPVDQEIADVPAIREEGDVTIIPVVEERAVVVTKLFLTEEIHIRRTRATETVDVPVNLRRQHAEITRLAPDPAGIDRAIDPDADGPDDR